MLEIVVVKGPSNTGEVFQLTQGQSYTIGRSSDSAIRLQSPGVSKHHCSITPLSGLRIQIEDLGSANGTYVNGLLVKKHVLKPGDTISIHQFVLQIRKQAPQLVVASPAKSHTRIHQVPSAGGFATAGLTNIAQFPQAPATAEAPSAARPGWFERNIYPLADQLSAKTGLVTLIFVSVFLWSIAVSVLSVNPFKNRANFRIQESSIEVAKLYARQLARINLDAIIDQKYSSLVTQLDTRRGQTPGIVESLILDKVNGQILAPSEKLGQPLPIDNQAAAVAISKDTEYVGIDENSNTAFVVVPIVVGTPDGNKPVASAFVRFNYVENQFNFAAVLDQTVNSILISLSFGWILFAFLFRWTEGTLRRSADLIQKALKNGETNISLPIKSKGAENLAQEIGYALSKTSSGSVQNMGFDPGSSGTNDWAISAVNNTGGAAAALDGKLTILAWNPRMANLLGIQESVAVGNEISQASRDVGFESAVRELAQEAVMLPWRNTSRQIDLSGHPHMLAVVWGGSAFLVNVDPLGGDL